MTAIVLPIWTPAAAWLVLCWLAVLVDVVVKRRRGRSSETARLRALGRASEDWAA